MARIGKALLLISLGGGAAGHADWQGRVVDIQRRPLAEVRVTLIPAGTTTLTDSAGTFRLAESAAAARPPRLRSAPSSPPGPRLGFLMPPEAPAADFRGRRAHPHGSPWLLLSPLPGPAVVPAQSAPPLAKVSGSTILTAEKSGYLTARLTVTAAASLPDLVLAPALDLSRPVLGVPMANPALRGGSVPFDRSTSTEIPNQYDTTGIRCIQVWNLHMEAGIEVFARSHTYFPFFPEKERSMEPGGISDGREQPFSVVYEDLATRLGETLIPMEGHAQYVNLLLRKPASGTGYGSMKWWQFEGPVPAGQSFMRANSKDPEAPRSPSAIRTVFSGTVPPLETCGRLSGRVVWKGAGDRPELWVGMVGTELFTRVASDGSFLSSDLPPGNPPLALVRVDRSDDGAAVPRAFHALEGLTVVSGQTAVLDSIVLAGD